MFIMCLNDKKSNESIDTMRKLEEKLRSRLNVRINRNYSISSSDRFSLIG